MAKSMSLDDLVALNDEIVGLVRSGVPLELGLSGWGGDLSGQLGRTATRLSESLERGQNLPDALEAERDQIPPIYHAIVTAGLRSGRLPVALESVARSARSLKEVRGAIGLALIYPLTLVVLAYFLILLLLAKVIPALLMIYDGRPPRFWTALAGLGSWVDSTIPIPGTDWVFFAAFIPPLVLVIAAVVWWRATRRALMLDMGSAGRWLAWLPVAGSVARNARAASLAELMGLMVEHDVPLDQAVVLAARSTADKRLVRSAEALAVSLSQGVPSAEAWRRLEGFPPLLAWLISSGGRKQTFTALAAHIAATYRRRIARQSRWLSEILPMWLILLVGGLVVTVFGVMVFLPFSQLMQAIADATSLSAKVWGKP